MAPQRKRIPLINATVDKRTHTQDGGDTSFEEIREMHLSDSDMCPTVRAPLLTMATNSTAGNQGWPMVGGATRGSSEAYKAVYKTYIDTSTDIDLIISNRMVPYKWDHNTASGGTWSRARQYTTGTVTTSGSDKSVTGTTTAWVLNAFPAYYMKFAGTVTTLYYISTVTDDTHIVLNTTPAAYTGSDYTIYASNAEQYVALPHIDKYGQNVLIFSYPTRLANYAAYSSQGRGPFFIADMQITTNFAFLNASYHANDFAVQAGYVVLGNTSEYDGTDWHNYKNRVRWSAPGTYSDFTGAGSGFSDLANIGNIMWLGATQAAVYVYGTAGTAVLRQTGDTTTPFSYQVIAQDVIMCSNPVFFNGSLYIWGADGRLYKCTDSGISTLPTPFTLDGYFDGVYGDETSWGTNMVYFSYSQCLRKFVVDLGNDTFIFSTDGQRAVKRTWPQQTSASYRYAFGYGNTYGPYGLVASYDDYASTSTSALFMTGYTTLNTADGDTGTSRYYPYIQTKQIALAPEKDQVLVKGVYVRTHVSTSVSPYVGADMVLFYLSGDNTTTTWRGCNIVNSSASFTSGNTSGAFAYNANHCIAVGDYLYNGTAFTRFYRVTAVTDSTSTGYTNVSIDRSSTATETLYHAKGKSLVGGDWEKLFGMNVITDKLELKLFIIPRSNDGRVKITGITIEYEPLGKRYEK